MKRKADCQVQKKLLTKNNDPLGAMLKDYLAGDRSAVLEVHSEVVEIWTMSGAIMFREYEAMDDLERAALAMCRGRVLDVGAGSGCHSLELQMMGSEVHALDISPGCIEVMQKRGVKNVIHDDLFSLSGLKFDTMLMLMNGIGICGNICGCRSFLENVRPLLASGGQIVVDSTDISPLFDGDYSFSPDNYSGEVDFVMHYKSISSDRFDWLYIDYLTLKTLLSASGFHSEKVLEMEDGRYLARIFQS